MDKGELIRTLNEALAVASTSNWTVLPGIEQCPTCDVLLNTPAFAAFFAVVDPKGSVAEWAERAQREIAELRHSEARWDHDLELVLVADESQVRGELAAVRKVLANRYTCRKFVLSVNGRPLRELLQSMPFWPPAELLAGPGTLVGSGIRALQGFDPSLITHIASYSPGVDSIAGSVIEGRYALHHAPAEQKATRARAVQRTEGIRLTGLDIAEFRGIRQLNHADMSFGADVVVVYGPNGVGKTSIADAFEWAVTGEVGRLSKYKQDSGLPDLLSHVLSQGASAKVVCHLGNRKVIGREHLARGTYATIGGKHASDNRDLIDAVVGTTAPTGGTRLTIGALRDLFRGSHLLGQHSMREFLTQTSADERFNILTSMIGAEEFVRFRQKTTDIRKRVESACRTHGVAMDQDGLRLREVNRRVEAAESELGQLKVLLGSTLAPETAIAELLGVAGRHGCSLAEDDLTSLEHEPLHQRLEFVRIQMEPLLASRRKEAAERVTRLRDIEAAAASYRGALAATATLRRQCSESEASAAQLQVKVQEGQASAPNAKQRVRELTNALQTATESHSRLAWLSVKIQELYQHRLRVDQIGAHLVQVTAQAKQGRDQSAEADQSLGNERRRLDALGQTAAKLSAAKTMVDSLRNRLVQMIAPLVGEIAGLTEREASLATELPAIAAKGQTARGRLRQVQADVERLQNGQAALTRQHGERQGALSTLAELVQSATCPLCGHAFDTAEKLKQEIAKQLAMVPYELRNVQQALQAALPQAQEAAQAAAAAEAALGQATKAIETTRQKKVDLARSVTAFMAECAGVGVDLPSDDPSRWSHLLEEASEARSPATLSAELAVARANIAGLENRASQLRANASTQASALSESELQAASARAALQQLEQEIVSQGFQLTTLPPPDEMGAAIAEALRAIEAARAPLAQAEASQRQDEVQLQEAIASLAKVREVIKTTRHSLDLKESEVSRFELLSAQMNVLPNAPGDAIRQAMGSAQAEVISLDKLEAMRQDLSKLARLEELSHQLDDLRNQQKAQEDRGRVALGKAQQLQQWVTRLDELEREAADQQLGAVGAHVKSLEPAIDLIYRRLNPHPLFGKIRVLVDEDDHTLRILAEAEGNDITVNPPGFFSDAQLNVLAISVFLAGALRQRWSALETIVIDDPIQQLDEMNVCAFLDLIRGLIPAKQFIIFTCSRDFYLLAMDKFSPLNNTRPQSFLAYRLEGVASDELIVHRDMPRKQMPDIQRA